MSLVVAALVVVGILMGLLLVDSRNSRNATETSSHYPQSAGRERQRHNRDGNADRRVPAEDRAGRDAGCSGLGFACASQYFAAWHWPADGSCQTTTRSGYPEPDRRCTPGGVVPGITANTLRSVNWSTRCIRNCQSTEHQKRAVYAWYGLAAPTQNTGETQVCELDHLVPLELGGADGMGNLWPQCGPEDVTLRARYFKQKDIVENYLAAKVRSGDMSLTEAQQGIAADWVQYLPIARAECRQSRCGVHPTEP